MRAKLSDFARMSEVARNEALTLLKILASDARAPGDEQKFRDFMRARFEDQVGMPIEEVRVKLLSGELKESPLIREWLICEDKIAHQNEATQTQAAEKG